MTYETKLITFHVIRVKVSSDSRCSRTLPNECLNKYVQISIQRSFEPDLDQTGKETLCTHRDNVDSEMEPLPEARRLSAERGNLPCLRKKQHREREMDRGGANPSKTWPP